MYSNTLSLPYCISSTHTVTPPLCLSRPVAVRRHISWRLAAWGIPLPCNVQLLAVQRARTQVERKKLSRSALHRQNLAKTRFSPAEKRYGHFKQPCQRLYNYWTRRTAPLVRGCVSSRLHHSLSVQHSALTLNYSGFPPLFHLTQFILHIHQGTACEIHHLLCSKMIQYLPDEPQQHTLLFWFEYRRPALQPSRLKPLRTMNLDPDVMNDTVGPLRLENVSNTHSYFQSNAFVH